jgi:hypothetical protein
VEKELGRGVVELVGVHRLDEADVVDVLGEGTETGVALREVGGLGLGKGVGEIHDVLVATIQFTQRRGEHGGSQRRILFGEEGVEVEDDVGDDGEGGEVGDGEVALDGGLVVASFFDPQPKEVNFFGFEGFAVVGWRHEVVRIGGGRALDHLAGVGVAHFDARSAFAAFGDSFEGVEVEIAFAILGVGSVAA